LASASRYTWIQIVQNGADRQPNEAITMLADVTEPGQSFAAELEKRS
jgi:hypothetical protein